MSKYILNFISTGWAVVIFRVNSYLGWDITGTIFFLSFVVFWLISAREIIK